MTDRRSPGVPTLTWVTLGLLTFSWLLKGSVLAWNLTTADTMGSDILVVTVAWAYASGPGVLTAVVTWINRSSFVSRVVNCIFASANGLVSAGTLAEIIHDVPGYCPLVAMCFVWPFGWLFCCLELLNAFLRLGEQAVESPSGGPPSVP